MTAVRLNDYSVCLGFEGVAKGNPEPIDEDEDDMDFLNN
jgi:hypothetical protein